MKLRLMLFLAVISFTGTITLADKDADDDASPAIRMSKRDTYQDPCAQLDEIISYLSYSIPGQIDTAKGSIESDLRLEAFKKTTQGWSIVLAGLKEVYGKFVNLDIEMTQVTTSDIYGYGFTFFYGLGFGLPLVLDSPDPNLTCGSEDYLHVQHKYGLGHDLENLVSQVGSKAARSLVNEFEAWAKLEIKCILDNGASSEDAFAIGCSIDELITAYNLKLDLIDQGKCSSGSAYSHQHHEHEEHHHHHPHSSLKKRLSAIEQNPEAVFEDDETMKYLVDTLVAHEAIAPFETSNVI